MTDLARADSHAARDRLADRGWIAPKAELFRHLPPPPAAVWLGGDAPPFSGGALDDGWSLRTLPGAPAGRVDLRWYDAADPGQRIALFSGLPPPGEDDAAPFAWAHRALVRQGLRVRIAAAGGPTLLQLDHRVSQPVEAPLLVVDLLPGARCVLLEAHERQPGPPTVQNLHVYVRLAEGASLQHLRVAAPLAADRWAHHVHVQVQRQASYAQCLLATGGDYHLQRTLLELDGEGASARAAGVLLAVEGGLEQQVLTRHAAARTRSAVEMLALPGAAARVVASAHTRIAAGCDEAQARQRLGGIPTSGQPRIVLRPHLEIHHDQVQAAHGATWGALPEEALFHARQRGLEETAAKSMILAGLARSVLSRAIADDDLPEALRLELALAAALARHLGTTAPSTEASHG
ncbi:SufD family Fe-S cluster assembly protein [Ramlibacter sp. USB13]|uniref:SufD family Fe-S cluster assembly protein n=1 Tax=Ramlibacter cellulosilyticus TaxID=2764187 RepID=A0A923MTG5_9BURK|nr:SufD family Fe-S cluster assembly protein [Ramlibacter cellulosilyticus]MBC5784701.1 SufD family Fe-S cluster assembly protein [Ramlibacter cellulosilyticus]